MTMTFSSFSLDNPGIKKTLSFFDYQFSDKQLLVQALIHSSFVNENSNFVSYSSEKMEFLGDSILNYLVTSIIVKKFTSLKEGALSKLRGALVNESTLADLARFICLGDCLLLGKGEIKTKGNEKDAILADAFEALLGAIYLDSGMKRTEEAFATLLLEYEKTKGVELIEIKALNEFDAKTKLQERIMKLFKVLPEYRKIQLPNKFFQVDVYVNQVRLGREVDISKKKAEHRLAKKVLTEKLYEIVRRV